MKFRRVGGRDHYLGRPASPGIGIGPAYVLERRELQVPHRHVNDVEGEVQRFLDAAAHAKRQLEQIAAKVQAAESQAIFQAQGMMLSDPSLSAQTQAKIRSDRVNAEWAVVMVTDEMRNALARASQEHLRDREHDLAFMTRRLLWALLGEHADEICAPPGSVVVAHDLSPAETASFLRNRVAGIVTEVGGPTSHAAILARAMEIPGVVGVQDGARLILEVESGDMVVVDGGHGRVHVRPTEAQMERFRGEASRHIDFHRRFRSEKNLPTVTRDGVRIRLRANLAFDAELDAAVANGAEGIGLYRTEHIFMNRPRFPTEEEHYRVAKRVLAACAPNPVVFRCFDLGADKHCALFPQDEPEANPALGLRSLRLALRHREQLLCQMRGLLRAALHGPAKLLLPLVSGIEELQAARAVLEEASVQLRDQGLPYAEHMELGVMIELPSAALTADELAKRVDFMSIGTNDLIQYTLAIDRGNEDVGYLYQPLHPAILRMIHQVCQAGKREGIPVSVCGEMASDPRYSWVLVGLGAQELSAHAASIPVLKNLLRASEYQEMSSLAQELLQASSLSGARALVERAMRERFAEHLEQGTAT